MEIGSFIELDLLKTGEFYSGEKNVARLNSARAGIYHALRLLDCHEIYMPYYQCPTVNEFLIKKGIIIHKYHISDFFEPKLEVVPANAAVLIVNYFGILSHEFIFAQSKKYQKVIIDNGPAFYTEPLTDCFNVYSPRKFFGVPDGCYVIGSSAEKFTNEYPEDYSASTSLFLLQRHESGCSSSYAERMKNEERIDQSGILNISRLSRLLLGNIDYQWIKEKRVRNFNYVCELYKKINLLDISIHADNACVPMIYPLVVEHETIVDELRKVQIFTGRRWSSVLKEVATDSFEGWMTRFMVPLPIDQRYELHHMDEVFQHVRRILAI